MLVIDNFAQRGRAARNDESGAILVTVVVVMLVGFVIAATIAASVIFTIGANEANEDRTEAFIAAESGRDVAVAAVAKGIADGDGNIACTAGLTIPPGGDSTYSYTATVRWATASTPPATWSSIAGGATSYSACPTPTSNWVVIRAIGSVPGGSSSTVDAAYGWSVVPDTRPAGTVAYFDGQFTATKSTYEGDLVIRGTDNYKCNNGAGNALKGDLWVTNASVEVTGDCWVTGSIYAYGFVSAQNKNLNVGGDIITETGDIDLKSDGVVVGGQLYAGHNVVLTKSGTVGNGTTIKAVCGVNPPGAACTLGAIPSTWTHADLSPVTGEVGQPKPTFEPTLKAVHDATAWLELDATKSLSADSEVFPNTSVPNVCSSAALAGILETAGDRAYIDMSACISGNAVTIQPNAATVRRSALFYVPPSTGMNLKLTNNLTDGGGDPQLLFVHGDSNVADGKPSACAQGPDALALPQATTIAVRTMIYSACGVNETMKLTMTGQLYLGTDGLHLNGGTFECAPMGWPPAFKNLACGVKGSGGIFDPDRTAQVLGALTHQTEQ